MILMILMILIDYCVNFSMEVGYTIQTSLKIEYCFFFNTIYTLCAIMDRIEEIEDKLSELETLYTSREVFTTSYIYSPVELRNLPQIIESFLIHPTHFTINAFDSLRIRQMNYVTPFKHNSYAWLTAMIEAFKEYEKECSRIIKNELSQWVLSDISEIIYSYHSIIRDS